MALVPSRNRRFETITGIFLLLVLSLIGLVILIMQSDADMSRFGITATTANLTTQIPTTTTQQDSILEAVVPDNFARLSEIETYNADNLYEKINGKAPLYIDSGFVKLSAQRFVNTNDENLWMEIYLFNMAHLRNAFSIYSVQRRPDAVIYENLDPQYVYGTDNALYLIIGQYYVEIVGSTKSQILSEAMTEIAQALTKTLAADSVTYIAELDLFAPEGLIKGSTKLYLTNAFGFEGLMDVFVCRYEINNETITAFFSKCSDSQAALANANSYYNFLIKNGAEDKSSTHPVLKDNQAKVLDFYGTTEIIFTAGSFMGGIHEADNQDSAEELAARLFEKLSK